MKKWELNENTKFLFKEHIENKLYDTTTLSVTATKEIEDVIYNVARDFHIDYDDALAVLVLLGAQHMYEE